jgi:hypothetical protein
MDPVALVSSLSWQFLVVCGGAAVPGGIGGIVPLFATGLPAAQPVDTEARRLKAKYDQRGWQ